MKVHKSKRLEKQSWPYDNAKQPLLTTFSQKIEFSIIQVLLQASNLKITAERPNGTPSPLPYLSVRRESVIYTVFGFDDIIISWGRTRRTR